LTPPLHGITEYCQSQSYVMTDGQSPSLSWCNVGLWGLHPMFCLSVNAPPINFWMAEQSFKKLGMYFVHHGIWAHLNDVHHKSLPSVCVSLCLSP
jgi:hypothetical protein